MLERWNQYCVKVVRGQEQGILPSLLKSLMILPSLGMHLVSSCRNWAFDKQYLSRYIAPVPLVISIGNLVAGGTGKTPVTIMLAQALAPEFPTAILSRGYHSPAEHLTLPIALSTGHGPQHPAQLCGDEPYLIAKTVPEAMVIVGKDRIASAQIAAQLGAQVILLDDGMQHRRLARDLDLVVLNARDPFGQGYLLPRGLLRESIHSLRRAHLILINHVQNEEQFDALCKQISYYSSAPVVGMRPELKGLTAYHGEAPTNLQNKRVGLFCGIANPEQFQEGLEKAGATIVTKRLLSDHQGLQTSHLLDFAEHSKQKGAEFLLCTEKDAVKLPDLPNLSLPIIAAQMRLTLISGEIHWSAFLNQAKQMLQNWI